MLGTEGDVVMRPIEADVDRKLLSDAVARLSPREKDIISLRFGLGGRKELTQKEVADRMGISQSYISRLEKRIISRLRRDIQKMSCGRAPGKPGAFCSKRALPFWNTTLMCCPG